MIGIGIIGSGVGIRIHAPGFQQTNNANLVGLYSPNQEKAQQLGPQHGFKRVHASYQELCEDPEVDLVVVTSPNQYHLPQTIHALQSGKHVLCEKPLALTLNECEKFVEEKNNAPNIFAGINHQLRFNPYIRKIREIIRSSDLGSPYYARIVHQVTGFSDPARPWSWSFDEASGGGVRWAMGSHAVDLLLFLFGKQVSRVFGMMHTVIPTRLKEGKKIPVNASASFSGEIVLEDGMNAQISASAAAVSGDEFNIDIYFEKGEVRFNSTEKIRVYKVGEPKPYHHYVDLPKVKEDEKNNSIPMFAGSFRYYADEITKALENNDLSMIRDAATFEEGQKVVAILESFLDSYKRGIAIEISAPQYRPDSF